jgi:hypothetical protein
MAVNEHHRLLQFRFPSPSLRIPSHSSGGWTERVRVTTGRPRGRGGGRWQERVRIDQARRRPAPPGRATHHLTWPEQCTATEGILGRHTRLLPLFKSSTATADGALPTCVVSGSGCLGPWCSYSYSRQTTWRQRGILSVAHTTSHKSMPAPSLLWLSKYRTHFKQYLYLTVVSPWTMATKECNRRALNFVDDDVLNGKQSTIDPSVRSVRMGRRKI